MGICRTIDEGETTYEAIDGQWKQGEWQHTPLRGTARGPEGREAALRHLAPAPATRSTLRHMQSTPSVRMSSSMPRLSAGDTYQLKLSLKNSSVFE